MQFPVCVANPDVIISMITFTFLKQPSMSYEQYSVATLAHVVLHGSYKPRHGVATPADSEE